MKIGIDAHFLSKISQGTGTYVYQLLKGIEKVSQDDLIYLLNKENIIDELFLNNDIFKWAKLKSDFTPYNILYGFNKLADSLELDIIHSNYLSPIFKPKTAKRIVTIHDILFKTHPEFFPKKLTYGLSTLSDFSLKTVDHIIAVSEYTKEQLIKYYPVSENKISVIYEAASPDFYKIEDKTNVYKYLLKEFDIDKEYIFFVGRFAPNKNIDTLIEYYTEYLDKERYDIVLVGSFDTAFPNPELENKLKVEKNIKHLKNVSNQQLNYLYNGATLLYFVSQGEGFGLPILEAMSAGCPVLTSSTTACNEIGANSAIKVNPKNKMDIFEALTYILENKEQQKQLSIKGIEHSLNFSWKKCAEQTLNVYKNESY